MLRAVSVYRFPPFRSELVIASSSPLAVLVGGCCFPTATAAAAAAAANNEVEEEEVASLWLLAASASLRFFAIIGAISGSVPSLECSECACELSFCSKGGAGHYYCVQHRVRTQKSYANVLAEDCRDDDQDVGDYEVKARRTLIPLRTNERRQWVVGFLSCQDGQVDSQLNLDLLYMDRLSTVQFICGRQLVLVILKETGGSLFYKNNVIKFTSMLSSHLAQLFTQVLSESMLLSQSNLLIFGYDIKASR
uniref:Uncharacterized protein n=1 Tax=Glossina brevipalpis TaxID=37001 RepID=A0A1A9W3T8_9MUSC